MTSAARDAQLKPWRLVRVFGFGLLRPRIVVPASLAIAVVGTYITVTRIAA